MAPTIRPATPNDIPIVLRFIRALADFAKLGTEVSATEDRLRSTLFPIDGRPVAYCVLAYSDDPTPEPVGFAIYFFNYSTFLARPGLYLEDLFVDARYRGRGVGKALLVHLAHLANERGCGRMEWAVLDWNQSAIRFYESLGAQRLLDCRICRLTGSALAQHA